MPSSQILKTPAIIQQAWNDGLFTLREKRRGVARGTSIEEKCMYVLGLGWKLKNNTEIRDVEIENTLYISLQGLTQEAKFLKIGQVLWEQCDENFILKMISSLSNNTPQQTKIYEQISLREQRNFKGYFSKQANRVIKKNAIDPNSILNRESKQMKSNAALNDNHKKNMEERRKAFESSKLNSKGFMNRLVKFKTNNAEIKLLIRELDVALKTVENGNLIDIALALGVEVESGFNQKFLIEEIKSRVASYVEYEILIGRSGSSKNVYIRQTPTGVEVIKRLLRYTTFAFLTFDGNVTTDELEAMGKNLSEMRAKAGRTGIKGVIDRVLGKTLDRKIDRRDQFLDRTKRREQTSKMFKKYGGKFKRSVSKPLYEFLRKHVSPEDGSMTFYTKNGTTFADHEAIEKWITFYSDEIRLGQAIITKEETQLSGIVNRLQFRSYSKAELLEKLIMTTDSMGIGKESYPVIGKDGFSVSDPGFYLVAILRRFLALQKEGNRFGILGFTKGRRGKELKDIMAKIDDNRIQKEKEKERDANAKTADGIFKPLSLDPKSFKNYQAVYVVGGAIYSFSAGGMSSVNMPEHTGDISSTVEVKKRWNKVFSGVRGRKAAFEMSSKGMNMGAFGTQEMPLEQGKNESNQTYIRRVIEAKMMPEFKEKGLSIKNSIQPVFLVNKGINTSNVEATALLNLIPSMLQAIPGIGTAAGLAFRSLLQSEIDAAKNLPKFARGGSFTTKNTNVSQFISGDSINNRINPEKVTIDWASQRVNVQPLTNVTNNVTNLESGRITDPILGTSTSTIKINDKSGKSTDAVNVYNAVNPFEENIKVSGVNASPMEVLISLKESLVEILGVLVTNNQTGQSNAVMTGKVVDAINSLNRNIGNNNTSSSNIFGALGPLARGE